VHDSAAAAVASNSPLPDAQGSRRDIPVAVRRVKPKPRRKKRRRKDSPEVAATDKRQHQTAEPLVVRPQVARVMLGNCSRDELWRKLQNGDLTSYLDGRRRLITVESIKADIARKAEAAASVGFQRARGTRAPA
jgi:hypothetical protein